MKPARQTIRRKLMAAMMGTSVTVLVMTCATFITYEVVTFRTNIVRGMTTRAEILAANSTAALAFQNAKDATEILAALRKDPRMIAGAIYDTSGQVFAVYPSDAAADTFPKPPPRAGYYFDKESLNLFVPVLQDNRWLGTAYLKSDLTALSQRYALYTIVVIAVITSAILLAFVLSIWLQKRIAEPILNLAATARNVSERKDYSLRAPKLTEDEIGVMTDSFNSMLEAIQQRTDSLRQSEARIRAILESALDAIISMDEEGRITEFNPAAETLFGYDRKQAVGAQLADLIIPPMLRQQHRDGLNRYRKTGEGPVLGRHLEMPAMRADAVEFPVELTIIRTAHDGSGQFTAFLRDITERTRAEREIRNLNAELERRVIDRTAQLEASNRDLEAFSYSVAHDLRAPLRAIDGFGSALLEEIGEKLGETPKDFLNRIRSATKHMALLIDELLKLSSMGLAPMKCQPVDLSKMATEIAEQLRKDEPNRNVSVTIAAGLATEADPHLVRLVLDNLLRNAWKFTSKHSAGLIEVGNLKTKDELVFFVRDDGAGFDMAHVNLLFKPFQRLHRKTDFDGTGIGLATVYRVIQRHGGRIWAEGAVKKGATFYFTLGKEGSDVT